MPKGDVPRNRLRKQMVTKRRFLELSGSKTSTPKERGKAWNAYNDAAAYGGLFRGPDKSKEWTTRSQRTVSARKKFLENWGMGLPNSNTLKLEKNTKAGRVGLKPISKTIRPSTSAKKGK